MAIFHFQHKKSVQMFVDQKKRKKNAVARVNIVVAIFEWFVG